jgi:ATP-dependent DNA helicase RecG
MGYGQLDRPAQFLKGVGPRRGDALKKLAIGTARDLLYHIPRRYDDASTIVPISRLEVGMDATARGRVRSAGIIPTRSGLRIFQAVLQDESGMITCSWPGQPWLERKVREGDHLLVSGPVKFFHGRQLHPREFTLLERKAKEGEAGSSMAEGTVFVSYPATDGLPQWVLRGIFEKNLDWILEHADEEEYLPSALRKELGLPELHEAFRRLHRPASVGDAEGGRRRIAFDELFFLQLVQALARHRETEEEPGIAHRRTNELIRPLHESLPFDLTGRRPGPPGDLRGHDLPPPDEPLCPGGRGVGKDAGGALRHAPGRGGRAPGGPHGAHRAPGRAARAEAEGAPGAAGGSGGAPHRVGDGEGP